MNNNPVKYSDPSGHDPWYCETAECEAKYDPFLAKLNYIQDTYGVIIDNSNGLWTMKFLQAIEKGMSTLQNAMGQDAFAKLFTGVTFDIGGGNVAPNHMATTGNRNIHIGLDVKTANYVERETVHELAHIWDDSCNDCMSKGMMKATGGQEINGVYFPGGTVPTTHADKRIEDWAESVTAFLYPGYLVNPLDAARDGYVMPCHFQ